MQDRLHRILLHCPSPCTCGRSRYRDCNCPPKCGFQAPAPPPGSHPDPVACSAPGPGRWHNARNSPPQRFHPGSVASAMYRQPAGPPTLNPQDNAGSRSIDDTWRIPGFRTGKVPHDNAVSAALSAGAFNPFPARWSAASCCPHRRISSGAACRHRAPHGQSVRQRNCPPHHFRRKPPPQSATLARRQTQ